VRFAYADPPYFGQGAKLYGEPEWDWPGTHEALLHRLVNEYPDGWALSCSSPTLRMMLQLLPPDPRIRVAAWCKSFGAFKRGVRPAYMWEPVIFSGGRNPGNGFPHPPPEKNGKQTTPKDFLVEPITLKKGLTGAKPERFCEWILELLNAQAGDVVDDLFPGTGIMGGVEARLRQGFEVPA
jgi:hypothetical protein